VVEDEAKVTVEEVVHTVITPGFSPKNATLFTGFRSWELNPFSFNYLANLLKILYNQAEREKKIC
jgi:hypothetical protein